MEFNIHPAIQLTFEFWMYAFGIFAVLYIIRKLKKANDIIEKAKYLPGGVFYDPQTDDEEMEELHA